MNYRTHLLRLLSTCLLFCVALSISAFADGSHERTQVGHNINVGPDEELSEATCFGCSIRVRGHVWGDVTTFGGNIVIEGQGQVGGDATTFGGNIRLDKEVKVRGDVTVFGGHVRRDPAASIGGDVTNMGGPGWMILIFLIPFVFFGLFVALIVWLIRLLVRPATPATA
jgi:cytoskeletal protein CcmA (bactofilin family)